MCSVMGTVTNKACLTGGQAFSKVLLHTRLASEVVEPNSASPCLLVRLLADPLTSLITALPTQHTTGCASCASEHRMSLLPAVLLLPLVSKQLPLWCKSIRLCCGCDFGCSLVELSSREPDCLNIVNEADERLLDDFGEMVGVCTICKHEA